MTTEERHKLAASLPHLRDRQNPALLVLPVLSPMQPGIRTDQTIRVGETEFLCFPVLVTLGDVFHPD